MTARPIPPEENFLHAVIGDGRPLIDLTGIALILSGAFALFLSATGSFLPHDVDFLGLQPAQLCAINQCRIVHFMFHDRVSFGGVLLCIGTLYLWLTHFPLDHGEEWAWWTLAISGAAGFASFLAYLGYGYLDTWHGAATLALLPCFIVGMEKARSLVQSPRVGLHSLRRPAPTAILTGRQRCGRFCLLLTGLGMIGGGAVITTVGMTTVFVPQDLVYLGMKPADFAAISPRLLPLIAHDRAGFGGGLFSAGLLVLTIVWKAPMTPALWQALLLAGLAGFGCAIGVHYPIGYRDPIHLTPAWAGGALFIAGMICSRNRSTDVSHVP